MKASDINIATQVLIHIVTQNRFAIGLERTTNVALKERAARSMYQVHGEPFGGEDLAVQIWSRFRQATTIN